MIVLPLADLANGRPALSPQRGAAAAEAAAVCFENSGHASGVTLDVASFSPDVYTVSWQPVAPTAKASWNDLQEAAEQGSYGMATLLVEQHLGVTVVERSVKGTGFDYYVGKSDASGDDLFQNVKRLEVSSIIQTGNIKGRVKKKLAQTRRSDNTGLPAVVVVVEYGPPRAEVADHA